MEQFRIWTTFENASRHLDTDWCNQDTMLRSLQRLTFGPAAMMGIISEIRVVDMFDRVVFLIVDGKQVFPSAIEAKRVV